MIIEPNTKTDFYYVDGDYIEFLKQARKTTAILPVFLMFTIGAPRSLCSVLFCL